MSNASWASKVFGACLLVLLLIPGATSAFTTATYLPLSSGNQWTFQANGSNYTRTVDSSTYSINGNATRRVNYSEGGQNYYSNDASGLRFHQEYYPSVYVSGVGYVAETDTLSPPLTYAAANASLGSPIYSSGILTSNLGAAGTYTFSYAATSTPQAFELVTVAAGTFYAVRIYATLTYYGYVGSTYVSRTITKTIWAAKNIGVVKEIQTDSSGNTTTTYVMTGTNIVNTVPDNLTVPPQTGAPASTPVTSDAVMITGITGSAGISISGASYSIDGGPFTTSPGTVSNGHFVSLQMNSPAGYGATQNATLTVGGQAAVFTVTTLAANSVAAMPYAPLNDGVSWVYQKNGTPGFSRSMANGTVNFAGTAVHAENSSDGYVYYATNDASGIRQLGDYNPSVFVSGYGNTTATETYYPPLKAADAYVVMGTPVTRNGTLVITFGGIGSYSFAYTATSTPILQEVVTVPAGTFSCIRVDSTNVITGYIGQTFSTITQTSSDWVAANVGRVKSISTTNNGGVVTTDTYLLTSSPLVDSLPDTFSFAPRTGVVLGSTVISNPVIVSGTTALVAISITGGQYSVNGGAYTAATGVVGAGDSVTVRIVAPGPGATASATLSIGGVSAAFNVTGSGSRARNDFNADGVSDLIWRQTSTGTIGVLFMNSDGAVSSWSGITANTDWTVVGTGDFNGDGIPDLLWRQTSTGLLGILFMSSNGTISNWTGLSTGTDWNVVATADFNGDGITDLVWRQTSTGTIGILFMSASGSVTSWTGITTDTDWNVVAATDFNGDGIPDLIWRQASTGLTGILFMNSNGTIQGWSGLAIGTDWNVVATADFNGDGIADLVWRQTSTGTIGILFMNSNGTVSSWSGITTDTDWTVVGTGDFNADGTPDLLWRQTSTGLLGILFMNSNGTINHWAGLSSGTDWSVTAAK